jgi:hypothetical protein
MLVWIPETINGKPLTINSFRELLKLKPEFSNDGYGYIWDEITKQEGGKSIESGWVLMATDVLPESRNKTYSDQKIMIERLNENDQTGWDVPMLGQAIVCIATEYLKSGKRLFGNDPLTYTRCQEKIGRFQLVVGGFAPSGLGVNFRNYGHVTVGVAGLWKF